MNKNIGLKIKELRKEKKLTQSQLAKLLNKSDITIRKWESGERTPNIETLKEISNILEAPLSILTGERDVSSLFASAGGLNDKSKVENLRKKLNINKIESDNINPKIEDSPSFKVIENIFKEAIIKGDINKMSKYIPKELKDKDIELLNQISVLKKEVNNVDDLSLKIDMLSKTIDKYEELVHNYEGIVVCLKSALSTTMSINKLLIENLAPKEGE